MESHDVRFTVNGLTQTVCLPCTIAQLLDRIGFKGTQVVIERNGNVLPRTELAVTQIEEGDRLEVIVPVAGG
jgi:sulfur carrier protein